MRVPAPARRVYLSSTVNPSRRAALLNRASRQTISRFEGSWSAPMRAAPSCKLSAARSACARSNRSAARRTASEGTISCQLSVNARAVDSAIDTSSAVNKFSRSRRARAEAISTGVPHQMITSGSRCSRPSICSRAGSSASRGMTAEQSQNFIAARASSSLVAIGLQCGQDSGIARQLRLQRPMNCSPRQRSNRWPHQPSRAKQGKSIGAAAGGFDAFQPRNRRIAVVNDDGMSRTYLAQIGAQVVLEL